MFIRGCVILHVVWVFGIILLVVEIDGKTLTNDSDGLAGAEKDGDVTSKAKKTPKTNTAELAPTATRTRQECKVPKKDKMKMIPFRVKNDAAYECVHRFKNQNEHTFVTIRMRLTSSEQKIGTRTLAGTQKAFVTKFSVVGPRSAMVFELPHMLNGQLMFHAEIPLCPLESQDRLISEGDVKVILDAIGVEDYYSVVMRADTLSPHPFTGEFKPIEARSIQLKPDNPEVKLISGVLSPVVKLFEFDDDEESFTLHVHSEDSQCGMLLVQPYQCPLQYMDYMISKETFRMTMRNQATVTYQRKNKEKKVFILFLSVPDATVCDGKVKKKVVDRKEFFVTVSRGHQGSLFGPILFPLILFCVLLILCGFKQCAHCIKRTFNREKINEVLSVRFHDVESVASGHTRNDDDKSDVIPVAEIGIAAAASEKLIEFSEKNSEQHQIADLNLLKLDADPACIDGPTSSTKEGMNPAMMHSSASSEVFHERQAQIHNFERDRLTFGDAVPPSVHACNSDVSCIFNLMGPEAKGAKLSTVLFDQVIEHYFWYAFVASAFYILPVLHLVVTFYNWNKTDGSQDKCFFNYKCSIPLGIFPAFNAVYSNLFYVLNGMLFMYIVYKKKQRFLEKNQPDEVVRGVPHRFDLLYTFGFTLICQGITSAAYHTCPNYSYLHFDLSFVFILVIEVMSYLFYARHRVTEPGVVFLACFIFVAISTIGGLIRNDFVIWCIIGLCSIGVLPFGLQLIYQDHIDFSIARPKQAMKSALHLVGESVKHGNYNALLMSRFGFVMFMFVFNIICCIYGWASEQLYIPSWLLSSLLFNLLIYFVYYLLNKIRAQESILLSTKVYLFCSVAFWALSLVFYFQSATDTKVSAAVSLERNRPCVVFGFYDYHDMWHFVSSVAAFFSFMVEIIISKTLK